MITTETLLAEDSKRKQLVRKPQLASLSRYCVSSLDARFPEAQHKRQQNVPIFKKIAFVRDNGGLFLGMLPNYIGGREVKDKVTRLMKFTLADNLARQYNYYGKRSDKKPFSELRLRHCVIESVKCKCVGDKHTHPAPQKNEVEPNCACVEANTQACECKCVTNKQKRKNRQLNELKSCTCAETQTQICKYKEQAQKTCKKPFHVHRRTSCVCKCTKAQAIERNFCTSRVLDCNVWKHENETNPSACCQADGIKSKQESFKSIFRQLIEPRECRRLANNLKLILPQINAPEPTCTCVERKTKAQNYQRAGKESLCREIGTSGMPNYKKCPREKVSHDFFCEGPRPTKMNRCIGCNKHNTKCPCIIPQCKQKYAQSSTYCKLDKRNKEKGVFTILCNMMLQPTNGFPVSKKCCKNRGTVCQVDNNEGGVLKKVCELLVEKQATPVGTEAMTQSRNYGRRHERAGREIFCKNRGTSGAPKPIQQRAEKEEYEEIVEEYPCYVDEQPYGTYKTVGIGTNCRFKFGLYKDRHAYGEPKHQYDFKRAIDQWNEVPLRQTGTKMDAPLKCGPNLHFCNTNAATQSRKYSGSHLRAGRETFYRNARTSCVSKNNNNSLEDYYTVINQPYLPCPPPPDRKAIRWGSDCSFSFEISKDSPPECPLQSKPCDKINLNQNKNSFYSKFIRQLVSPQNNERPTGRSDACTCTDSCQERNNEHRCNNLSKPCERRPLHIGSKISYHLNISKSISPPKSECLVVQEPCIKPIRPQRIETGCNAISSACIPVNKNYDIKGTERVTQSREKAKSGLESKPEKIIDIKAFIDNIKTAKKRFIEVSKKNFSRLIKGEQSEIDKTEPTLEQLLQSPRIIQNENIICPAECNRKCEPVNKPDQPFRIGSRCSFDYNIQYANPKHEKPPYEELKLEDFSGSATKMNLFRLIIGRLRKRTKRKPLEYVANDPIDCCERKQSSNSWCAQLKEYIIENIKEERQLDASYEDAKKFFSSILLKNLKNKKSKNDSCIVSNFEKLLKETTRPPNRSNKLKSFLREMLSRKGERRRRRRRRCRSGSSSYLDAIESMDIDTLASSILTPSRRSRLSDEDYPPCQITSECSFKCDYNKLDESDNETGSTKSTTDSTNYATN